VVQLTKGNSGGEGRRRLRVQLTRRRAVEASSSGNYTSFVGTMKIVLPAVAVGIILLVVAWPQFQSHDEGFRVGVSSITPEDAQNLRMVNPRYQGTDKRGEPFAVTAESAVKRSPQSDVVELNNPMADITVAQGSWIALKADYGVYREQDQQLDLVGKVDLYHDDGYEFETLAAHINMVNNTAEGDDPVHGQGPFGTIVSQGFRILDKGQRVIFTGKAHLLLRPREEGGGGTPDVLPSINVNQPISAGKSPK